MFKVSEIMTTPPEVFSTELLRKDYVISAARLVMDRSVYESEWFACTDGTATCFVKIKTRDLLDKYLSGKELTVISPDGK